MFQLLSTHFSITSLFGLHGNEKPGKIQNFENVNLRPGAFLEKPDHLSIKCVTKTLVYTCGL